MVDRSLLMPTFAKMSAETGQSKFRLWVGDSCVVDECLRSRNLTVAILEVRGEI